MLKSQSEKKAYFTQQLLLWHQQKNKRTMPWKGEKDPYKIWLSEIILQQTRVEQGLEYYNKFINKYPDIRQLAKAKDQEIFKLWEGLGYYSRCKNLIVTARYISSELKGIFPSKYEDILKLKGVGAYTAAAIGSFAFNLPYAVVDGNVNRVLSRYFAISTPIDSSIGKKQFGNLAQDLLKKEQPGTYNQAIMDFGATVCKPQNPFCDACPLAVNCSAFQKKSILKYPVKEKTITVKKRYYYYLVVQYQDFLLVKKRTEKDIWQNLYEFLLFEEKSPIAIEKFLQSQRVKDQIGSNFTVLNCSNWIFQKLTHQHIQGIFVSVVLDKKRNFPEYEYVHFKKIGQLAFPKLITEYLSDFKLIKN